DREAHRWRAIFCRCIGLGCYLDGDCADTLADRVSRIGGEVHQNLLELTRVGADRRHLLDPLANRDAGRQGWAQQLERTYRKLSQIGGAALRLGLPRERKNAADEI